MSSLDAIGIADHRAENTSPQSRAGQGYGERNQHKSFKALIGVAVLIGGGLLFYGLSAKPAGGHAASPVGAHRVAHSFHR